MNTPITFRDVEPSPALQAHVTSLADDLKKEISDLTSCRVTVGRTNRHHRQGDSFSVHVEVHVPHATLNAERTSGERDDVYAAVDAAFEDLQRRLRDHFERARERRNEQ